MRICSSLLIWHNGKPFLNKVITGDEKRNLRKYKESAARPETSARIIAKQDLHERKAMLRLWWNTKGPAYYKLLKHGHILHANIYCNPFNKWNQAVKKNRPISLNRKEILQNPLMQLWGNKSWMKLTWRGCSHWSTISTDDVAQTDYYLFRLLQPYPMAKKYSPFEAISMAVAEYFRSKNVNLNTRRIKKLSVR